MKGLTDKRTGNNPVDVNRMIPKIKDDIHFPENNMTGIGAKQGLNIFISADNFGVIGQFLNDGIQSLHIMGSRIGHFQFMFDISFQIRNITFGFGRKNDVVFHNLRKSMP
jgi:hypothetical protein